MRRYIEDRSIPVPEAGCWLWLKSFGSHGYGNAAFRGLVTVAHRLSFAAFHGQIPPGVLVQHSCDNRWCVAPNHLSLGTDATNALDKQRKGRAAKKLNPAIVTEIRSLDMPIRAIARRFGLSQATIQGVRRGRTWSHVGEDAA